ncbi:MAG: sugar phosphate isomerase/epimerase family protein [Spirochaetia bacterium]
MGSLNISCALWSLTKGPTDEELEAALKTVAGIGIKAVQLWCVDDAKSNTFTVLDPDRCTGAKRMEWARRIRNDFGLEISGFCAQLTGKDELGNFAGTDDLDERLRKTQESLRLAVDMESPIVTTHIGPVPEDRNSPVYKQYVECVRQVADVAEECGGIFAIEVGLESGEVLLGLIEDVGSPNVKVNFDPANMLPYGTPEGVRLLKDHIVHSHAKDRHINRATGKLASKDVPLGRGDVPWAQFFDAMAEIGYEGWYAIEDESGDNIAESIKRGYEFLIQF